MEQCIIFAILAIAFFVFAYRWKKRKENSIGNKLDELIEPNYDIDTETHMSVAKYWYEKYGAVPAHIRADMLEFYAPQPLPEDKCPELSEQQFAYCPDIVYQEYSNLATFEHIIKESRVWTFWWD